ncbi:MAG: caspase family protein [Thermoguttaceae bacterium]|nr:caspase family protein [Thermoguttaceae bacterium]
MSKKKGASDGVVTLGAIATVLVSLLCVVAGETWQNAPDANASNKENLADDAGVGTGITPRTPTRTGAPARPNGVASPIEIARPYGFSEVSVNCVRRAVLIGVDEYYEFNNLRFSGADVELVTARLKELGFEPENIVALTTAAGKKDSRLAPNRKNIERELKRILEVSGPEDMIFVMFSGHGFQKKNFGGYETYAGFAPLDAYASDVDGVEFESTISLSRFFDDLEASRAKFKWALVDACRAEVGANALNVHGAKAALSSNALQPLNPPPGVAILQSCGAGEYSYEIDAWGHGLFTQAFAESLSEEGDADEDGVVTFMEAALRTQRVVKEATMNRDNFKTSQTPYVRGDFSDFALVGVNTATARAHYDAAVKARLNRDYATALKEIGEALEFSPRKELFLLEKQTIEDFVEITSQLEALKAALRERGGDEDISVTLGIATPEEEIAPPAAETASSTSSP